MKRLMTANRKIWSWYHQLYVGLFARQTMTVGWSSVAEQIETQTGNLKVYAVSGSREYTWLKILLLALQT